MVTDDGPLDRRKTDGHRKHNVSAAETIVGDRALENNKKHESNGSSDILFRSYETPTVQYYVQTFYRSPKFMQFSVRSYIKGNKS